MSKDNVKNKEKVPSVGWYAESPQELRINPALTTSPSLRNERRALLIGPGYHDLPDTDKDVCKMKKLLESFQFGSIETLCGEEATRGNIIRKWEDLIKECKYDDAVVIYYAGHGGMIERPKQFTATAGTCPSRIQYLIPSQFDHKFTQWSGIFDDELSHLLQQTTNKTPNVTYILDCCHSARLGRKPAGLPAGTEVLCRGLEDDKEYYERVLELKRDPKHHQIEEESWSNPSVVRLSAASESNLAWQYQTGRNGWTGIMTKHLIESLQSTDRESMSWRNIMVEVAARVRHFEGSDQEPRSAGADTRIPFVTEQERSKIFSATISRDPKFTGASIRSGRIHGITSGCTFDLIPINRNSEGQPPSQTIKEVRVKKLKTFYCAAAFSQPAEDFPFKSNDLVLARQHPMTMSGHEILVAQNVKGLEDLRTAISNHRRLTIPNEGEQCDLRIQLSQGDPNKNELQGLLDGEPRFFVQLTKDKNPRKKIDNLLLVAERLIAAKSLLQLNDGQDRDEWLPAELTIEVRKVTFAGGKDYVSLKEYSINRKSGDTFTTDLAVLSFREKDEYQIVLEGLTREDYYASVFRVDAAGNIILVSRPWETGVEIRETQGRRLLSRGQSGLDELGMVLYWPPEVAPLRAVRESFVVVVTNGQADLRSLETVAAKDYYDKMARGPNESVAIFNSVDKFRRIRIDYELHPAAQQDDTGGRMTAEKTKKYWGQCVSPEDIPESEDIDTSLKSTLAAERGSGGLLRRFQNIPPFVWVINGHDEWITVTVSRVRPSRYLTQLGLQVGTTSGGGSVDFDYREPAPCKKRLAPSSDSQRSRAKFPLRKDRIGVISIWRGEEMEPFIEGDDVSAGKIYWFDNTPDLREQEADPMEVL